MSLPFLDDCIYVASAGGTGAFGVSGAAAGYQAPATAPGYADGVTYAYRAQSSDLSQWEYGRCVGSSTGTSFTRVVTKNSLGTTATINFTLPPTIMMTFLAADMATPSVNNNFTAPQTLPNVILNCNPVNAWGIDTTGIVSPTGLAASGGTMSLSAGSGLVCIGDNSVTGSIGIFLVGGGAVTLIAQTSTLYATSVTAGKISLTYNSGTGLYVVTNDYAGIITVAVTGIRIRASA